MPQPHRCEARPDGTNQYTAQAIVATNGKAAALQVLVNTLTHTAEHEVPYRMETTAEGGLHITVSRKH
ncbi:hypothetical protein O5621_13905 [Escherichia coli]|nr:hypothetical protein [Escherichia coli]